MRISRPLCLLYIFDIVGYMSTANELLSLYYTYVRVRMCRFIIGDYEKYRMLSYNEVGSIYLQKHLIICNEAIVTHLFTNLNTKYHFYYSCILTKINTVHYGERSLSKIDCEYQIINSALNHISSCSISEINLRNIRL